MRWLNEVLGKWEPLWLFSVLALELLAGVFTAYMVTLEYWYDFSKDEAKRQRRTKTSKKTTTKPGGESITEEVTETEEPSK